MKLHEIHSYNRGLLVGFIWWVSIPQKETIKAKNPQRDSTEIVIEIKQLYSGQIASNPFITSNRRYMLFPPREHFII